MPKMKSTEVQLEEALDLFIARVKELWEEHQGRIEEVIMESEDKKLNISFKCGLDFSESIAGVDSSISFSETITDKRHNDIDPPEQLQIPGTERRAHEPNPEDDGATADTQEQSPNVVELHKPAKKPKKKKD